MWTHGVLAAALLAVATGASGATLDKVRESGKLVIGYSKDARPFAFADSKGKASGYAIAVCDRIAESIRTELKLPALDVGYVPLSPEEAFRAVDEGRVDLLCGAMPTLERRLLVDFSIPVILTGTGAAVRSDAPPRLVQALAGGTAGNRPVWRASTDQAPQRARLAVIGGAPIEKILTAQLRQRRIVADVVPVASVDAGLQLLADRGADAFIGDRLLLVDAVGRSDAGSSVVLDRLFRRDLVALATHRNDDDFRLLVDRTLSRMYRTEDMAALYTKHFGAPSQAVRDFFDLVALPD